MNFSPDDIQAILLSLKLASLVTAILLTIGTPIAWWLTTTSSWLKGPVNALIALPLVLPPTVLGFYFLLFFSPQGGFGSFLKGLGFSPLPFTFQGLVIASLIYSLPFVVQPLYNSFQGIGKRPLEVAATSGASPIDAFITVVLPLSKQGFITAAILGFVHTIGEFGVVLMIGGNIPGETRVVSVQIYEHVETMNYAYAHSLCAFMVLFSFIVLLLLNQVQRQHSPLPL